jgi:hypothetical protein
LGNIGKSDGDVKAKPRRGKDWTCGTGKPTVDPKAGALDGLFLMVAEEEKKIRQDPVARTTDLLKKVFGSR